MHQLDLGNICSSLVGESKVTVFNSLDGFIDTCGVNDTLGVRLVGNTSELEVLDRELGLGVDVLGLLLVCVKLPREDITVPTS